VGLLGVRVTWAVVTASALVTICRAQQRLLGMMHVIPKMGGLRCLWDLSFLVLLAPYKLYSLNWNYDLIW